MTSYITRTLAQQIVDTVRDLCGQNVNFIDCSGIIFASTDADRIGTFHEVGQQAAASGSVIEVRENNRFTGTQQGVNLPVYHNHRLIAVIGITGNPDEVRKYAKLAERITRLLIREKELDAFNRNEAEKKSYILRGLIEQEDIHPDYLRENLAKWKLNEKSSCQLLRLRLNDTDAPSLSPSLDSAIQNLFYRLDCQLFTFVYPNEYLAVVNEEVFHHSRQILVDFAQKHIDTLCIAVGNPVLIHNLADSAFSAEIALKSLPTGTNYAEASSLDLELILASINSRNKKAFLEKTLDKLSPEDLKLLRIYFSCDMSLKKTCEETFLHKNTIQYQLNHIYKKCGYNPRKFQDAVRLYLALKM
ncbi:CdaR family transcriptional regulator [Blautia sp. MSJ-19]|uniref:CdaR family transcriptional regulator n=1 Tax=Blautia sp. MSJ-19 TaxID=2841517 RepID=UPI001C0EB74C|nr:sugar diacid recognition domain-containing protein [Blautia sp. MSJ-19]MBU5480490.1 helix-turn-helix domain-containing protein [Blautia sp. MSJ-19]